MPPPGTTSAKGSGTSSNALSGISAMGVSESTGSTRSATKTVLYSREVLTRPLVRPMKAVIGPTTSSGVNPG